MYFECAVCETMFLHGDLGILLISPKFDKFSCLKSVIFLSYIDPIFTFTYTHIHTRTYIRIYLYLHI